MTNDEQRQILLSIRQDDAPTFDKLTGKRKNLCFGRFSLLSLCYLYGSRRIVARYERAMRQDNPTLYPELAETYRDFARTAGRALRLWAGYVQHDVHPLEMLAVTGDWRTLRRAFPTYASDESLQSRLLTAIRLRYGIEASIREGHLILPPKPLTAKAKRLLLTATVAVVVILLSSLAVLSLGVVYSDGIPVGDAATLATAESGKQYTLRRDITIDSPVEWADFTLHGNGHTITVEVGNRPIWQTFGGTVTDCHVVLRLPALSVGEQYACLAIVNEGTWRSVRFTFEQEEGQNIRLAGFSREEGATSETCPFGGLFVTNRGTVEDCTIAGDLRWTGQSVVDGEVGIVAAINEGAITGCTLEGGIYTDTVDVGGVVFRNELTGIVRDCTLAASCTVRQTTAAYQWSPMVGGVAAFNYGIIENTYVMGTVASAKEGVEYPDTEAISISIIYAGGVAAHNYGTIRHSLSAGEISASGEYTACYTGGIAADNVWNDEEEQVRGRLEANITAAKLYGEGYYVYIGGVAGASSGYLVGNCYNCSDEKLPDWYAQAGLYVGTLLGYGNFDSATAGTLFADNHVIQLSYGRISVLPVIGSYAQAGGMGVSTMNGVTSHGRTDFGTLEAYWYEQTN